LPEGFQRSEYLEEHGMVDMVVHRHQLRSTIARLCRLLGGAEPVSRPAVIEAEIIAPEKPEELPAPEPKA